MLPSFSLCFSVSISHARYVRRVLSFGRSLQENLSARVVSSLMSMLRVQRKAYFCTSANSVPSLGLLPCLRAQLMLRVTVEARFCTNANPSSLLSVPLVFPYLYLSRLSYSLSFEALCKNIRPAPWLWRGCVPAQIRRIMIIH